MASGVFQRAPGLDYEMDNLEADVFDVGGQAPSNILSAGQPWELHMEWEAVGASVPWFNDVATVDVYVESIGPGVEAQVGNANVNIVGGQINYQPPPIPLAPVAIPAGQTSIMVKITTTITANGSPVAGFVEGPMLQFI